MADEKKFAAKRRNLYIHSIKTPVNDRKSEQDKNLQNPIKTNEVRENTTCAKIP